VAKKEKTRKEIQERRTTLDKRRAEKESKLLEKLKPQREKQLAKNADEQKAASKAGSHEPKPTDALNRRVPGAFGTGKRR
jgi:hypothetical protein